MNRAVAIRTSRRLPLPDESRSVHAHCPRCTCQDRCHCRRRTNRTERLADNVHKSGSPSNWSLDTCRVSSSNLDTGHKETLERRRSTRRSAVRCCTTSNEPACNSDTCQSGCMEVGIPETGCFGRSRNAKEGNGHRRLMTKCSRALGCTLDNCAVDRTRGSDRDHIDERVESPEQTGRAG